MQGEAHDIPIGYVAWKKQVRHAINAFLQQSFEKYPDTEVRQAAQYSTMGGGHRWRPLVAIAAGLIFREDAMEAVLPAASAIELAHAASLILDDLPSMDNADIRRGKPSTHTVYPSWAVDMTPVFLINMSYNLSLSNKHVAECRRIRTALAATRAGLDMIAGQVEDIKQQRHEDEASRLLKLYQKKSGSLYAAAGTIGALSSGASQKDADVISEACMNLGLAYQFNDDIADVTADVDTVGKAPGMDAGKFTAVDLLGIAGAKKRSIEFQTIGLGLLSRYGDSADNLRTLIHEASWKAH